MSFTINEIMSPNYVGKTVDASLEEQILNLESPNLNPSIKLVISKSDTSTNKVIIKYNGATIKELSSPYEGASLVVSGDTWVEA